MTVPATPVGSPDELAQFELPSLSVNSTYFLAQAEAFFAEQLKLPDPEPLASGPKKLSRTELAKIKDLCEDVMDFATGDALLRLGRPTWLGWWFAWFERFMSSPWWPPSNWTVGWPISRQNQAARIPVLPGVATSKFSQCAPEFLLFDGLSRVYGGRFRGAVVVNCMLGVVATTFVLYSLVSEHSGGGSGRAIWTFIELGCLTIIGLIYYRGSTPDSVAADEGADEPALNWHFDQRRWHQRWLEYRILAERFRYVNMLLPLGEDIVLQLAIAPTRSADLMWHQRYFEWHAKNLEVSAPPARQYHDHALAVIAAQEDYHKLNHRRRGTVARRLHWLGKGAFIGALATCIVDILFAFFPAAKLAPGTDGPFAWLMTHSLSFLESVCPFLGAWLPVFAAAAYAILTHAEYAKAAEASGETYEYIQQLSEQLASIPSSADDLDTKVPAGMKSIVIEFVGTAIAEASGWRAMLRDKNVPLA